MTNPATGRLPRGPHHLTRAEVIASQRGRLSFAALEAMAEIGYTQTTVADIVKRAQVSRRTFYEAFANRDECLTAGFDLAVELVEGAMNSAIAAAGRLAWRDLVHTTLDAYLRTLVDEPVLAQTLHVESLAARDALKDQRWRVQSIFADRMRAVCQLAVDQGDIAQPPPPEMFDLLIGGIDDRIRHCLHFHGAAALPDLAPSLYRATLALFGKPEHR